MDRRSFLAATGALALPTLAMPAIAGAAALPKVVIGMSGWTGFAPLSLAEDAGIFRKNGVDATTRFVPQSGRNLAFMSGALNCLVTTIDTMITWASGGVPLTQVLVLDKSKGADGIVAKPAITTVAGLKGRSVGADAPGTTPYFLLAYVLYKNGLSIKDVNYATVDPQAAAQAFIAGRFDAASTYEPYLSEVRKLGPAKAHILVSTLQYPVIEDTLAFGPAFIKANPAAVRAVVQSWFDALAMIKRDPEKSFAMMGKHVKQTAAQFASSASYLTWQDRVMNQAYMKGPMQAFTKDAAAVLKDTGVIKKIPDLSALLDPSFV